MKRLLALAGLVAALVMVPATVPAAEPMPPLVSPEWLAANFDRPGLKVLDARSNRKAFRAGRVPGAVYTDYGRDGWREERDGVPGLLPSVEELETVVGSLGIDNDTDVVLVAPGAGAADMGIATRLYWTFKVLGHDRVSVLDGGMQGYHAIGGPLVAGVTESPTARRFQAEPRPTLLATTEQTRAALDGPTTLIDNRPPAQFADRETSDAVVRQGAIPGALNVPAIAMTGAKDGFFRDRAALGRLFTEAGADPARPAITYCNTGHWASIGWFVLSELLGNGDVRLYDGSLAAWSRDPGLPLTRGATR